MPTGPLNRRDSRTGPHRKAGVIKVPVKLDMAGITPGSPIIKAKFTTDNPTSDWAASAGIEVSNTPIGFLEVQAGTSGTLVGYIAIFS
jgi:hypothetical protein